ncbi:hypothetical protein [Bacillus sp. JCM 19034]|uniref:hypothetical protein n=1 Tax=Bacillus sp. JCM 19034 TaxID=1481928 RepID=UPI000AFD8392
MNKKEVIERHNPHISKVEANAPLSLGNGDFGFSVDFTGLQSFPNSYDAPLSTQSNWGWHYTKGKRAYKNEDIRYQSYETYGRNVDYPMKPEDKEEAYHWLRQNPHRLQLGRISFRFLSKLGTKVEINQITQINQKLNLWTGTLHSQFLVEEVPVEVITVCHPHRDEIGVKVVSPLMKEKRLEIFTLFSNPDMTHTSWSKSIFPDYDHKDRHDSTMNHMVNNTALLQRRMDDDVYFVQWNWSEGELKQTDTHEFTLSPSYKTTELEFTLHFASKKSKSSNSAFYEILKASEQYWESFWLKGGCADFSGSTDQRAFELERRVVLSQYLCAVHSGGSLPHKRQGLCIIVGLGNFI